MHLNRKKTSNFLSIYFFPTASRKGGREWNLCGKTTAGLVCHIRNIQPVCVGVADLDNDDGVFLKAPVMHRKSRFSTYLGLGVQTSH